MSNIVQISTKEKYKVEYVFDGDRVVAVTHPEWPFRIMRENNKIALVCEDTNEPFGELDRDTFNGVIAAWLLIDDPSWFDAVQEDG